MMAAQPAQHNKRILQLLPSHRVCVNTVETPLHCSSVTAAALAVRLLKRHSRLTLSILMPVVSSRKAAMSSAFQIWWP